DKITYSDVRDLILAKLGRLPGKLPEGRLYTGARKMPDGNPLGQAAENINVALEALLRIRSDITKQLGDKDNLDANKILELQNLLLEIKTSGQNREISDSLKKLTYELNSYPFFTGNLHSTWSYCDRIIFLSRKGDAISTLKNLR